MDHWYAACTCQANRLGAVTLDVTPVIGRRKAAHPAIEELQALGAGMALGREVMAYDGGQAVKQRVPGFRVTVHQSLGLDEIPRRAALDGVAGQRERRSGETDQRHLAAQRFHRQANRFEHVPQVPLRVQRRQARNLLGGAERPSDDRAFTGRECESEVQGLEGQQDVRKNDGGVDPDVLHRLQGHFARQLGPMADLEKGGLGADGPVLRHVATGLPHEPDRGVGGALPTDGCPKSFTRQESCLPPLLPHTSSPA